MEIIHYWLGSAIVSLLIALAGAIYAGTKLGFDHKPSSEAMFWTLLGTVFALLPVVNIVVGIMTACVFVKETKR